MKKNIKTEINIFEHPFIFVITGLSPILALLTQMALYLLGNASHLSNWLYFIRTGYFLTPGFSHQANVLCRQVNLAFCKKVCTLVWEPYFTSRSYTLDTACPNKAY